MLKKKQLILIAGPTAVGKTALAIALARILRTEIISADSRQFFREIPIGTAQPTLQEQSEIKHHFIGHLSVHQPYNVGLFEQDAIQKINELFQKKDQLIVVGGSGLHVQAIVSGLDDLPSSDSTLRDNLNEELRLKGLIFLQNKLLELDPKASDCVVLNNPQRVIRALELLILGKKPLADLLQKKQKIRDFDSICFGLELPRDVLYKNINDRADQMFAAGLLEEAQKVYPFRQLTALKTVGFSELFAHFDGDLTLEQAKEKIKQHTRNFAKRQMTWFKNKTNLYWLNRLETNEVLLDKLLKYL